MQIDLPADLIERAKLIAAPGQDAAAVFGEALNSLEAERQTIAAVQQGIAAYESGDYQPLDDFDRAFRRQRNISPDA